MKMKMKRVALFLTVISVFAAIGVCGCGKEEKNVIFVTSGEVKEGEEITVYLRATDEIPVAAYGFDVYYDPEVLTFKECDKTEDFQKAWGGLDVFNDKEGEEDGKRDVIFVGVNTKKRQEFYKGDLYYITFTATGKKGTKADLTLKVSALEDTDQQEHLEEYTVKNGTIKIK